MVCDGIMKDYNVAIVGATGVVGREFIKVLLQRSFPMASIRLLASDRSAGKRLLVAEQELVYSSYGAFQELFRAVGYDTAEKISEAAMTIWENGNQYDRKFLNSGTLYGAVAVYKSGEIYYITYIADYFK